MKTLVVRVWWGARRESKEQCAEHLADCLSRLRSVSPLFTTWKALGRSRREASAEIDTTASALPRRLRQIYSDIPRKSMPSLGFRFGAWAGEFKGPSAGILVTCGAYDNPTGWSNCVVLDINCDGSWAHVSRSTIRSLFNGLIESWSAEGGTAGFGLFYALGSDIDWMIYLGVQQEPPSLPQPTTVERLPDGGTIITIAPEPPDLRRSEEAKQVERVHQSLKAVAILGEVPQTRSSD